jgi:parvulin-like peptidyl-prolyl isomerase
MNSYRLTVAVLVFTVVGCGADHSSLIAAGPMPPAAEPAPVAAARSQKPDGEQTTQVVAALESPRPLRIEGEIVARPRAIVNGEPILDDELRATVIQVKAQMDQTQMSEAEKVARLKDVIRAELDKLIERELILTEAYSRLLKRPEAYQKLQEAANKEFDKQMRSMKERIRSQGFPCDTDEQFVALLEQQGMTMAALRRQSERSFMAMEYMKHRIYPAVEKIDHRAIREYYDEHPGEFQAEDRVKWQDIFIANSKHPSPAAARHHAEALAAQARQAADFAELSKKFDDGDSGPYRGGAGLGQKRGEIRPPEVEAFLFRMREGEIGPIIETFNGFHVIKLVEREYAGLHPFDEKTQQDIRKKLQGIIADREYKRLMNELRSKATIQIVEDWK